MASATKELLSGSTNGRGIAVAATATPGTAIHTATATAGVRDEIWLWAVNQTTSAAKLTVEFGGVTANDIIEQTVAPEDGLVLVCPGLVLAGGLAVTAFGAVASALTVFGYCNRVTN